METVKKWVVGSLGLVAILRVRGAPQASTCQDELNLIEGLESTCVVSDHVLPCRDRHHHCSYWASFGECSVNPVYMNTNCPASCGRCNNVAMSESSEDMMDSVKQVQEALGVSREQVQEIWKLASLHLEETKQNYPDLRKLCVNGHELCSIWSVLGECDRNPDYMKTTCAPACQSCEYLSIDTRCPLDPTTPNSWGPGDLDRMFRRISTDEKFRSTYSIQVLSSPESDGPWVLVAEDIITQDEATTLIELGALEGYQRSTDVGPLKPDGTTENLVSRSRTSTNAWCQNECYANETAQQVMYRLSNLTGINETNSEYLQLLRYEPGQFYEIHHDFIPLENERQQGPWILTVYLYLNDVEAGGGTNFPELNVTVFPKRGRALLWPSVLDAKPTQQDDRTKHQALPVEAGVKYGANAWFHLRDFKTPNSKNCM